MNETTLLWVAAIGSVVTGLATIGLVWVAWFALNGTRAQVALIREDSQRQTRPYVYIQIEPGLHGPGFWDLVVRNTGRTSAQDVRIDVGPLPPVDDKDHISAALAAYLAEPKFLPPAARQRVMWRMDKIGVVGKQAGAPVVATAEITYSDNQGGSYSESCVLSLETYAKVAPAPTTGPEVSGNDKELANVLRALRTLNSHVGELRR